MNFDAFTIIVFIFILAALATVVILIRQKSKEDLLNLFRSSTHISNGKLILPEEMSIGLGVVRIKGLWRSSGRSRYYDANVEVLNELAMSTNVIEIKKVCSDSFYVYVDRNNNTFIEAPGFVVKSGKFRDIIVLCLEPSYIPEKVVEVVVGDPIENAQGKVKVSHSGLELSLTWLFNAPSQKKMVYDEKHGVYKVVDEYTSKPRARGSRLEICFQTPDAKKKCVSLARSNKPNTHVYNSVQFKIKEKLVFLQKDLLETHTYNIFKNILETDEEPISIGYKPSYITAKIVLDVPLTRDIVKEVEL